MACSPSSPAKEDRLTKDNVYSVCANRYSIILYVFTETSELPPRSEEDFQHDLGFAGLFGGEVGDLCQCNRPALFAHAWLSTSERDLHVLR